MALDQVEWDFTASHPACGLLLTKTAMPTSSAFQPCETPPLILTFNASDPTGAGGLQADVITISSMGGHPLSVVTALTIQDTLGTDSVIAIDADTVIEQARTLLEDMPVAAFKIGLVGNVEGITALAEIMADYPDIPLIIDPQMASKRGDQLVSDEYIEAMVEMLIPQATLICANLLEARHLLGDALDDDEDASITDIAGKLLALGTEFVLITGTQEGSADIINRLFSEDDGQILETNWARLPVSFAGAGATLSAGIATGLANGLTVAEAVLDAQDFTFQTLLHAFRPGMGLLVPDRLYWAMNSEDENAAAIPPLVS